MTALDRDRPEGVDAEYVYVEFQEDGTTNDRSDPDSWADPGETEHCEDRDGVMLIEDMWCCELTGNQYSHDHEHGSIITGRYRESVGPVCLEAARDSQRLLELDEDEYGCCVFACTRSDSIVECNDTSTYFLECDAYESRCGYAYFADEYLRDDYDSENGVQNGDAVICDYHGSPAPVEVFGADDVRYRVGFEVEKSALTPVASDLWAGFEEDSSCGYEAITNILPLTTDAAYNGDTLSAMRDAASVLDEEASSDCGGHVTISDCERTSEDLAVAFRTRAGFVYAPWAYRLRNQYCGGENPEKHRLLPVLNREGTDKYSPMNVKPFGVEWRLPNAVTSADCLVNRYRYFAAIVETFGMPWTDAVAYIRPFMVALYDGDEVKAEQRLRDAGDWQAYVDRDAVTPLVARVTRQVQRAGNAQPCGPELIPEGWNRAHVVRAWETHAQVEGAVSSGISYVDAVAYAVERNCDSIPANPTLPYLVPEGWQRHHLNYAYVANSRVSTQPEGYDDSISVTYSRLIPDNPHAPDLSPEGWTPCQLEEAYRLNFVRGGFTLSEFQDRVADLDVPLAPGVVRYTLPDGWTEDHMGMAFRASHERNVYGVHDRDFLRFVERLPAREATYALPDGWTAETMMWAYGVAGARAHGGCPDIVRRWTAHIPDRPAQYALPDGWTEDDMRNAFLIHGLRMGSGWDAAIESRTRRIPDRVTSQQPRRTYQATDAVLCQA